MKSIVVASGKGGTGKTTVAVSLADVLSDRCRTVLTDCDVEAPNAHLYLEQNFQTAKRVNIFIPEIDHNCCSSCGTCAEVCRYHAVVMLLEKPVIFPELCHGCGSCSLACPEAAVREIPKRIGQLERDQRSLKMIFQQGKLDIGQPLAVPVISTLKAWKIPRSADVQILDSPPGASCPVVETMRGSDYVLLVTEPTPFGLHDLKQAEEITRQLGIPRGVVVNRVGVGDQAVEEYCRENQIPVLLKIPYDGDIGRETARGQKLINVHPRYRSQFEELADSIMTGLEYRGME